MRCMGVSKAARSAVRFNAAAPVLIAFAAIACSTAPRIATAAELVAQLRAAGIPIDSQEPAPLQTAEYFRIDESVRVKGAGLFLDILRIEDRRVFDIAKAGQHIPDNPEVFARHPFVVIIRERPDAVELEASLAKLLPPERE